MPKPWSTPPPSERDLYWFGYILPATGTLIAAALLWFEMPAAALIAALAFVVVTCIYHCVAALKRSIYSLWMGIIRPVGWLLFNVLLAILYYALLTPIGIMRRVLGYDVLQIRGHRQSGWTRRKPPAGLYRYFEKF